ncbi:hypothetical protein ACFLYK_00040 [Candidatus Cloacimonadota bacterium]
MRFGIIIPLICLFTVLCGCAAQQGIIQKEDISYLQLVGDLNNITFQIDDGVLTAVDSEIEDVVLYEVKPGIHVITVFRNNEMIVKRELFFDNQIIKEVSVK